MIIRKASVLFLLLGMAQSVSAVQEKDSKSISNKYSQTKIKPYLHSAQITTVGKGNIEHQAHQVCAVDDNGQDWQKLQTVMSKQLLQVAEQRKFKQLQHLSKQSVSYFRSTRYQDNGVDGRYYIPVVFHIYGDDFNCDDEKQKCLTDEKIQDALTRTNEDFLGTNSQDGPIDPIFQAIRENLNIEFVLAKKDPNGNDSNGIVRYAQNKKGYGNGSGYDSQIAQDAWDNDRYMNIYIMKDLYDDGSTNNSGVAWYPEQSMTDRNLARVVYNGLYVGSNTNENFRSVLTHEFGHWLNLPHTFAGNSCSLENESFCGLSGDRSCDTPQMSLSTDMYNNSLNCLGQKTNTENFMHYTSNYAMFTADQVKRMTAALHSPMRSSLWSNANLVATGLQQYTSNSERYWDGVSGIDKAPEGEIIASYSDLSGAKGERETFEISVPQGSQAVGFYLSQYRQDPDMYVSLGKDSRQDEKGNWIADFISFEAAGTPEFVGVLAPDSTTPYHVTIDAFSAYSGAKLEAYGVDDPLLAQGSKRHHVLLQNDIWSPKGKEPKQYQINIPANADKTVVVLAGKYGGDPDLYVSLDKPVQVNKDLDDCVPFSAAKLAEYCEFDKGGQVNILIDPFAEYWESQLHVYYETSDSSNQAPIAITKPKYRAIVNHEVHFKGYQSIDVDGEITHYAWQFGDGNSSNEKDPVHIYNEIGEYTATLTVTDAEGVSATTEAKVNITLLSPDDETLCDNCKRVYLTEQIDLSAEQGQTPRSYQFLVPNAASLVAIEIVGGSNGDPDLHVSRNKEVSTSVYDCRPYEGPGAAEVCHFKQGGVYNAIIDTPKAYSAVTFKAYYDIDKDADDSLPNQLPIAVIDTPAYAYINSPIEISGANSSDVDGDIVRYQWQLGSAQYTTELVQHPFAQLGMQAIKLTVTDNDDGQHSVSKSIQVLPVGDMDQDGDVDSLDLRQFILAIRQGKEIDSAFDLNRDGRINTRDVRLFRKLCSYSNCSANAPTPKAPEIKFTYPDQIVKDQAVAFSSAATVADPTDKYGYITSYLWQFGDGTTSQEANPSHTFSAAGEKQVSLTVTNNKGLTSTVTESLAVVHPALKQGECAVTDGSQLQPSKAKCVPEQKRRYDFTMAAMNQHTSAAITVGFAQGEFSLYYKNGGWPSAHSEVYDFKVQGDGSACLYLTLNSEQDYWGYIQATGELKGASIVIDYDVTGCRTLSNN